MAETIPTIHTERLDLILMTPAFLEIAIRGEQAKAAQLLGVNIPADWWPVDGYIPLRLEQALRNPALQPWLGRAIVLRSSQTMVGSIAFHMATEPAEVRPLGPGGVELGYTIFPQFRRQGYAKEACQALMNWAQQHQVTRFILSISPTNQPSLQIAKHFGFVKIGSQIDEEDGLEDIYERRYDPLDS
ncbi:MAG: GNAT family N-acetyltransferase [Chloroflexi bacterium]|nr:GNAT family N-acetyltransferase [Chloroflexota bacterium]